MVADKDRSTHLNEAVREIDELIEDLYHALLILRGVEHQLSRIERRACTLKATMEALRAPLQSVAKSQTHSDISGQG